MFRKIISIFILIVFTFTSLGIPEAYAQRAFSLPVPGTLVPLSEGFHPAILKGMTVYPENPFQFDFMIDAGEENLKGQALEDESQKLIKYFLASLTTPEKEMWVNLSPYEEERIIPNSFGQTVMGRDLLAQDYMLKQLTASLMYPEEELGREFWDKIYRKVKEKYGTTEVMIDTYHKVWILPESSRVHVNGNHVFVVDSKLKVMMEEDYLALKENRQPPNTENQKITTEVLREVLLPAIEHEVNHGKNFANLRQVFHSMILATWYKQNLRDTIIAKGYVNQHKIDGFVVEDKQANQKIYQQYLDAFKKGVYNYIKEEYDPITQRVIPRKYFSGGVDAAMLPQTIIPIQVSDLAMAGTPMTASVNLVTEQPDAAMVTADDKDSFYTSETVTPVEPEWTQRTKEYIAQWRILKARASMPSLAWNETILEPDQNGNTQRLGQMHRQKFLERDPAIWNLYFYLYSEPDPYVRRVVSGTFINNTTDIQGFFPINEFRSHLLYPLQNVSLLGLPELPKGIKHNDLEAIRIKRFAMLDTLSWFASLDVLEDNIRQVLDRDAQKWGVSATERLNEIETFVRQHPRDALARLKADNMWEVVVAELIRLAIIKFEKKQPGAPYTFLYTYLELFMSRFLLDRYSQEVNQILSRIKGAAAMTSRSAEQDAAMSKPDSDEWKDDFFFENNSVTVSEEFFTEAFKLYKQKYTSEIDPLSIQSILIPGNSSNRLAITTLAEEFPNARIVVVDWVEEIVDRENEHWEQSDLKGRVEYRLGDIRNLKGVVEEESFDLVWVARVLDMYYGEDDLHNVSRIISELRYSLKFEGVLLAEVYGADVDQRIKEIGFSGHPDNEEDRITFSFYRKIEEAKDGGLAPTMTSSRPAEQEEDDAAMANPKVGKFLEEWKSYRGDILYPAALNDLTAVRVLRDHFPNAKRIILNDALLSGQSDITITYSRKTGIDPPADVTDLEAVAKYLEGVFRFNFEEEDIQRIDILRAKQVKVSFLHEEGLIKFNLVLDTSDEEELEFYYLPGRIQSHTDRKMGVIYVDFPGHHGGLSRSEVFWSNLAEILDNEPGYLLVNLNDLAKYTQGRGGVMTLGNPDLQDEEVNMLLHPEDGEHEPFRIFAKRSKIEEGASRSLDQADQVFASAMIATRRPAEQAKADAAMSNHDGGIHPIIGYADSMNVDQARRIFHLEMDRAKQTGFLQKEDYKSAVWFWKRLTDKDEGILSFFFKHRRVGENLEEELEFFEKLGEEILSYWDDMGWTDIFHPMTAPIFNLPEPTDMFLLNFVRRMAFRRVVNDDEEAKMHMLWGIGSGLGHHLGFIGSHFEAFEVRDEELKNYAEKEFGIELKRFKGKPGKWVGNLDHDMMRYAAREMIKILSEYKNVEVDFLDKKYALESKTLKVTVRDAMFWGLGMMLHPIAHHPKFHYEDPLQDHLLTVEQAKAFIDEAYDGMSLEEYRDSRINSIFEDVSEPADRRLILDQINQSLDRLFDQGIIDPRIFIWHEGTHLGIGDVFNNNPDVIPEFTFRGEKVTPLGLHYPMMINIFSLMIIDRSGKANIEYYEKGAEARGEFYRLYLILKTGEMPQISNLYPDSTNVSDEQYFMTPKIIEKTREISLDVLVPFSSPRLLKLLVGRLGIHPNFEALEYKGKVLSKEEAPELVDKDETVRFIYGKAAAMTTRRPSGSAWQASTRPAEQEEATKSQPSEASVGDAAMSDAEILEAFQSNENEPIERALAANATKSDFEKMHALVEQGLKERGIKRIELIEDESGEGGRVNIYAQDGNRIGGFLYQKQVWRVLLHGSFLYAKYRRQRYMPMMLQWWATHKNLRKFAGLPIESVQMFYSLKAAAVLNTKGNDVRYTATMPTQVPDAAMSEKVVKRIGKTEGVRKLQDVVSDVQGLLDENSRSEVALLNQINIKLDGLEEHLASFKGDDYGSLEENFTPSNQAARMNLDERIFDFGDGMWNKIAILGDQKTMGHGGRHKVGKARMVVDLEDVSRWMLFISIGGQIKYLSSRTGAWQDLNVSSHQQYTSVSTMLENLEIRQFLHRTHQSYYENYLNLQKELSQRTSRFYSSHGNAKTLKFSAGHYGIKSGGVRVSLPITSPKRNQDSEDNVKKSTWNFLEENLEVIYQSDSDTNSQFIYLRDKNNPEEGVLILKGYTGITIYSHDGRKEEINYPVDGSITLSNQVFIDDLLMKMLFDHHPEYWKPVTSKFSRGAFKLVGGKVRTLINFILRDDIFVRMISVDAKRFSSRVPRVIHYRGGKIVNRVFLIGPGQVTMDNFGGYDDSSQDLLTLNGTHFQMGDIIKKYEEGEERIDFKNLPTVIRPKKINRVSKSDYRKEKRGEVFFADEDGNWHKRFISQIVSTKEEVNEVGINHELERINVTYAFLTQARFKEKRKRLVKYGLNYRQAEQLRALRLEGRVTMVPYGLWRNQKTARNSILVTLDSIRGFRKARENGDIKRMNELYSKYVIPYDPVNKGKYRYQGQQTFFMERGQLLTLMSIEGGFLDKRHSGSALARFAIPELFDSNHPHAINIVDVEIAREKVDQAAAMTTHLAEQREEASAAMVGTVADAKNTLKEMQANLVASDATHDWDATHSELEPLYTDLKTIMQSIENNDAEMQRLAEFIMNASEIEFGLHGTNFRLGLTLSRKIAAIDFLTSAEAKAQGKHVQILIDKTQPSNWMLLVSHGGEYYARTSRADSEWHKLEYTQGAKRMPTQSIFQVTDVADFHDDVLENYFDIPQNRQLEKAHWLEVNGSKEKFPNMIEVTPPRWFKTTLGKRELTIPNLNADGWSVLKEKLKKTGKERFVSIFFDEGKHRNESYGDLFVVRFHRRGIKVYVGEEAQSIIPYAQEGEANRIGVTLMASYFRKLYELYSSKEWNDRTSKYKGTIELGNVEAQTGVSLKAVIQEGIGVRTLPTNVESILGWAPLVQYYKDEDVLMNVHRLSPKEVFVDAVGDLDDPDEPIVILSGDNIHLHNVRNILQDQGHDTHRLDAILKDGEKLKSSKRYQYVKIPGETKWVPINGQWQLRKVVRIVQKETSEYTVVRSMHKTMIDKRVELFRAFFPQLENVTYDDIQHVLPLLELLFSSDPHSAGSDDVIENLLHWITHLQENEDTYLDYYEVSDIKANIALDENGNNFDESYEKSIRQWLLRLVDRIRGEDSERFADFLSELDLLYIQREWYRTRGKGRDGSASSSKTVFFSAMKARSAIAAAMTSRPAEQPDAAMKTLSDGNIAYFADMDSFLKSAKVWRQDIGVGYYIGIKDALDTELSVAIESMRKLHEIDESITMPGPKIIWQNASLGTAYPVFTSRIKKQWGIVEIDLHEHSVIDSKLIQELKRSRFVLIKNRISSTKMIEASSSSRALLAWREKILGKITELARELKTIVIMIDHSRKKLSGAQEMVDLYAKISGGRAVAFNALQGFDVPKLANTLDPVKEGDIILFNVNPGNKRSSLDNTAFVNADIKDHYLDDDVSINGELRNRNALVQQLHGQVMEREFIKAGLLDAAMSILNPLSEVLTQWQEHEGVVLYPAGLNDIRSLMSLRAYFPKARLVINDALIKREAGLMEKYLERTGLEIPDISNLDALAEFLSQLFLSQEDTYVKVKNVESVVQKDKGLIQFKLKLEDEFIGDIELSELEELEFDYLPGKIEEQEELYAGVIYVNYPGYGGSLVEKNVFWDAVSAIHTDRPGHLIIRNDDLRRFDTFGNKLKRGGFLQVYRDLGDEVSISISTIRKREERFKIFQRKSGFLGDDQQSESVPALVGVTDEAVAAMTTSRPAEQEEASAAMMGSRRGFIKRITAAGLLAGLPVSGAKVAEGLKQAKVEPVKGFNASIREIAYALFLIENKRSNDKNIKPEDFAKIVKKNIKTQEHKLPETFNKWVSQYFGAKTLKEKQKIIEALNRDHFLPNGTFLFFDQTNKNVLDYRFAVHPSDVQVLWLGGAKFYVLYLEKINDRPVKSNANYYDRHGVITFEKDGVGKTAQTKSGKFVEVKLYDRTNKHFNEAKQLASQLYGRSWARLNKEDRYLLLVKQIMMNELSHVFDVDPKTKQPEHYMKDHEAVSNLSSMTVPGMEHYTLGWLLMNAAPTRHYEWNNMWDYAHQAALTIDKLYQQAHKEGLVTEERKNDFTARGKPRVEAMYKTTIEQVKALASLDARKLRALARAEYKKITKFDKMPIDYFDVNKQGRLVARDQAMVGDAAMSVPAPTPADQGDVHSTGGGAALLAGPDYKDDTGGGDKPSTPGVGIDKVQEELRSLDAVLDKVETNARYYDVRQELNAAYANLIGVISKFSSSDRQDLKQLIFDKKILQFNTRKVLLTLGESLSGKVSVIDYKDKAGQKRLIRFFIDPEDPSNWMIIVNVGRRFYLRTSQHARWDDISEEQGSVIPMTTIFGFSQAVNFHDQVVENHFDVYDNRLKAMELRESLEPFDSRNVDFVRFGSNKKLPWDLAPIELAIPSTEKNLTWKFLSAHISERSSKGNEGGFYALQDNDDQDNNLFVIKLLRGGIRVYSGPAAKNSIYYPSGSEPERVHDVLTDTFFLRQLEKHKSDEHWVKKAGETADRIQMGNATEGATGVRVAAHTKSDVDVHQINAHIGTRFGWIPSVIYKRGEDLVMNIYRISQKEVVCDGIGNFDDPDEPVVIFHGNSFHMHEAIKALRRNDVDTSNLEDILGDDVNPVPTKYKVVKTEERRWVLTAKGWQRKRVIYVMKVGSQEEKESIKYERSRGKLAWVYKMSNATYPLLTWERIEQYLMDQSTGEYNPASDEQLRQVVGDIEALKETLRARIKARLNEEYDQLSFDKKRELESELHRAEWVEQIFEDVLQASLEMQEIQDRFNNVLEQNGERDRDLDDIEYAFKGMFRQLPKVAKKKSPEESVDHVCAKFNGVLSGPISRASQRLSPVMVNHVVNYHLGGQALHFGKDFKGKVAVIEHYSREDAKQKDAMIMIDKNDPSNYLVIVRWNDQVFLRASKRDYKQVEGTAGLNEGVINLIDLLRNEDFLSFYNTILGTKLKPEDYQGREHVKGGRNVLDGYEGVITTLIKNFPDADLHRLWLYFRLRTGKYVNPETFRQKVSRMPEAGYKKKTSRSQAYKLDGYEEEIKKLIKDNPKIHTYPQLLKKFIEVTGVQVSLQAFRNKLKSDPDQYGFVPKRSKLDKYEDELFELVRNYPNVGTYMDLHAFFIKDYDVEIGLQAFKNKMNSVEHKFGFKEGGRALPTEYRPIDVAFIIPVYLTDEDIQKYFERIRKGDREALGEFAENLMWIVHEELDEHAWKKHTDYYYESYSIGFVMVHKLLEVLARNEIQKVETVERAVRTYIERNLFDWRQRVEEARSVYVPFQDEVKTYGKGEEDRNGETELSQYPDRGFMGQSHVYAEAVDEVQHFGPNTVHGLINEYETEMARQLRDRQKLLDELVQQRQKQRRKNQKIKLGDEFLVEDEDLTEDELEIRRLIDEDPLVAETQLDSLEKGTNFDDQKEKSALAVVDGFTVYWSVEKAGRFVNKKMIDELYPEIEKRIQAFLKKGWLIGRLDSFSERFNLVLQRYEDPDDPNSGKVLIVICDSMDKLQKDPLAIDERIAEYRDRNWSEQEVEPLVLGQPGVSEIEPSKKQDDVDHRKDHEAKEPILEQLPVDFDDKKQEEQQQEKIDVEQEEAEFVQLQVRGQKVYFAKSRFIQEKEFKRFSEEIERKLGYYLDTPLTERGNFNQREMPQIKRIYLSGKYRLYFREFKGVGKARGNDVIVILGFASTGAVKNKQNSFLLNNRFHAELMRASNISEFKAERFQPFEDFNAQEATAAMVSTSEQEFDAAMANGAVMNNSVLREIFLRIIQGSSEQSILTSFGHLFGVPFEMTLSSRTFFRNVDGVEIVIRKLLAGTTTWELSHDKERGLHIKILKSKDDFAYVDLRKLFEREDKKSVRIDAQWNPLPVQSRMLNDLLSLGEVRLAIPVQANLADAYQTLIESLGIDERYFVRVKLAWRGGEPPEGHFINRLHEIRKRDLKDKNQRIVLLALSSGYSTITYNTEESTIYFPYQDYQKYFGGEQQSASLEEYLALLRGGIINFLREKGWDARTTWSDLMAEGYSFKLRVLDSADAPIRFAVDLFKKGKPVKIRRGSLEDMSFSIFPEQGVMIIDDFEPGFSTAPLIKERALLREILKQKMKEGVIRPGFGLAAYALPKLQKLVGGIETIYPMVSSDPGDQELLALYAKHYTGLDGLQVEHREKLVRLGGYITLYAKLPNLVSHAMIVRDQDKIADPAMNQDLDEQSVAIQNALDAMQAKAISDEQDRGVEQFDEDLLVLENLGYSLLDQDISHQESFNDNRIPLNGTQIELGDSLHDRVVLFQAERQDGTTHAMWMVDKLKPSNWLAMVYYQDKIYLHSSHEPGWGVVERVDYGKRSKEANGNGFGKFDFYAVHPAAFFHDRVTRHFNNTQSVIEDVLLRGDQEEKWKDYQKKSHGALRVESSFAKDVSKLSIALPLTSSKFWKPIVGDVEILDSKSGDRSIQAFRDKRDPKHYVILVKTMRSGVLVYTPQGLVEVIPYPQKDSRRTENSVVLDTFFFNVLYKYHRDKKWKKSTTQNSKRELDLGRKNVHAFPKKKSVDLYYLDTHGLRGKVGWFPIAFYANDLGLAGSAAVNVLMNVYKPGIPSGFVTDGVDGFNNAEQPVIAVKGNRSQGHTIAHALEAIASNDENPWYSTRKWRSALKDKPRIDNRKTYIRKEVIEPRWMYANGKWQRREFIFMVESGGEEEKWVDDINAQSIDKWVERFKRIFRISEGDEQIERFLSILAHLLRVPKDQLSLITSERILLSIFGEKNGHENKDRREMREWLERHLEGVVSDPHVKHKIREVLREDNLVSFAMTKDSNPAMVEDFINPDEEVLGSFNFNMKEVSTPRGLLPAAKRRFESFEATHNKKIHPNVVKFAVKLQYAFEEWLLSFLDIDQISNDIWVPVLDNITDAVKERYGKEKMEEGEVLILLKEVEDDYVIILVDKGIGWKGGEIEDGYSTRREAPKRIDGDDDYIGGVGLNDGTGRHAISLVREELEKIGGSYELKNRREYDGKQGAVTTLMIPIDVLDGQGRGSEAMTVNKGGIDFDPGLMEMETTGNRIKFELQDTPMQIKPEDIKALYPIIINIAPITNLPMLLGAAEEGEDEEPRANQHREEYYREVKTDKSRLPDGFELENLDSYPSEVILP